MIQAVTQLNNGAKLKLRVIFGKRNAFPYGYDTWRDRILISINIEPKEGKANGRIIALIAAFFDIKTADVKIVSGLKIRDKTVYLKVDYEKVNSLINNALKI